MDRALPLPWLARLAALLALATAGCASLRTTPEPGTGDVAFRLRWEGPADLDLHVLDPAGDPVDFIRRSSPSGGVLDIDCNAHQRCADPIENVFWPVGAAPDGTYEVWVQLFRVNDVQPPVAYVLEVLGGTEVVLRLPGELSEQLEEGERFRVLYGAGRIRLEAAERRADDAS